MIGNAVPPIFAHHLANAVSCALLALGTQVRGLKKHEQATQIVKKAQKR